MNAPACIYFSFKINVYFRGLFQQITSFRTPSILLFFLLGVHSHLITPFPPSPILVRVCLLYRGKCSNKAKKTCPDSFRKSFRTGDFYCSSSHETRVSRSLPHDLAHRWGIDLGPRQNMSIKVGRQSRDMRIFCRIVGAQSAEQSVGIIIRDY